MVRRRFFSCGPGVSASAGGGGGEASKSILLGAPKFLETALTTTKHIEAHNCESITRASDPILDVCVIVKIIILQ